MSSSGLLRAAAWVCLGGLLAAGCRGGADDPVAGLVASIQDACLEQDAGLVLALADREYADELGGVGRLGDDLRHLFAVYGALRLEILALAPVEDGWLRGRARVEGKALRYEGPLAWRLRPGAVGTLVSSGLLSELRGVLYALRLRRQALESGDVERLGEVVSMEYRGPGGDRRALLERSRAEFGGRQGLAWIARGVGIVVDQDEARVEAEFLAVERVEGQSVERTDRERLVLRREGSRWRIVDGLG
ncbi:MAG TPA: nuclear transport factor 2 family protein [Myxococcota bacterium]|nr:nuclear transport factor 2 family protein [Myxococcota bacterium]HRY94304.1 nuclear transport factor 2 family protein [Myxococcota bacterium]